MKYSSREDIIVIFIFGIAGLIIPSVVVMQHFLGVDPLSLLHLSWGRTGLGIAFTVLATLVCFLNLYLSLIVPWLYERHHGTLADFAGMSGLPIIGSFFVFCAGALMPPSVPLGIYLLLIYVIDGNGLPWFFISIVR